MATTNRAFRRQAEAKKKNARPIVTFTLDWVDDEDEEKVLRSDTFTATMPTDDRLFMIAAMAGSEDTSGSAEAAAVMDIFRAALSPADFRTLKERLRDPDDDVDVMMLTEVVEWLMEEWVDFPTQPSSGSTASRTSTGQRSTGRVRGPGSTH